MLGYSLSGYLLSLDGLYFMEELSLPNWPAPFYIFGTVGVLWYPLWLCYGYDNPQTHPTISIKEYNKITKNLKI